MIFSKDLLLQAYAHAQFFCNGVQLDPQDPWDFYYQDHEVNVAVDSRILQPNELFFALAGNATDGHNFLDHAHKAGAAAFIVHTFGQKEQALLSPELIGNRLIIKVDNTTQALFSLAKAWRSRLSCPVVGITGSIGKTSTKEIVRSILHHAGVRFFVSHKNQNTFTGLCINLLRVQQDCEVAAFEVGISKPGEMDIKADILQPTLGLITAIAHAHLLEFETLSNISHEKRRLFKHFQAQDVGIIFGDQPLLTDAYYFHPIAKFGFKTKNQVQARKIKIVTDEATGTSSTEFVIKWYGEKALVRMKNNHVGLVQNALAASTIAYFLKIPFASVIKGIQAYEGFEDRFETKPIKGSRGIIISDCYNANPESMKAAIIAFDKISSLGKKIVVLGDMLELGDKQAFWHRQIGRILGKTETIAAAVLVGENARMIAKTAPEEIEIAWAPSWQEAQEHLEKLLPQKDALVLVKASHGMVLHNIVDAITQ